MLKAILSILLSVFILSCGQVSNQPEPTTKTVVKDSVPLNLINSKDTIIETTNSIHLLLTDYLKHSMNELVSLARKGTIAEEGLFDRMEKTDTANYYVFQIGHDFTDNDGKRFITDSWVYIDSAKQKIYEYDFDNDGLTEWKKH